MVCKPIEECDFPSGSFDVVILSAILEHLYDPDATIAAISRVVKPGGVLYLENNLASHVFTPARISVLKLLSSQAAISLENARLYQEIRSHANALEVKVKERTRELGMLRAVGMSRRQVRRMIRHESIITSLLGATFGIPLGVVMALLVGGAINFAAFTVPWGTLIVFVIAAIIAGIVAAILPARRAAHLSLGKLRAAARQRTALHRRWRSERALLRPT
ncbi:methyltransferase domain-containing protein [Lacticaseibacillus rhamnosus]